MGEAYGFFDSAGSLTDIIRASIAAIGVAQMPSDIELVFYPIERLPLKPGLDEVVALSIDAQLPYALAASHNAMPNARVAGQLANFFNALYLDRTLFPQEEYMRAEVVYDDGQGYTTY